jgi:methyltransferase (TIGR00027 family)
MTTIANVSGTAFVVAEFRAEENDAAAPLYQDPIVGLFLNRETRRAADSVAASFRPVKDLVKIRTRYFDDVLERQLGQHVTQVVILGAGLDTRAVRKPLAGVTYFEIDDPETLAIKQACYAREGLTVDVRFIPGNYVTDGLIDLLKQNQFDFAAPAYFIWEGNTMYLSPDDNVRILSDLRNHVQRFCVSFDYMSELVIKKTTGDPGITRMVESFARMGAPWLTGFGDIRAFARQLCLNVIDNVQTAELHQSYWPGRPLVSPVFNHYSVCTLEFTRPTLAE